jgi:hypothetical protein
MTRRWRRQLTANGMPLYAYSGDASATDINGRGKGGVWFLPAQTAGAQRAGRLAVAPPAIVRLRLLLSRQCHG